MSMDGKTLEQIRETLLERRKRIDRLAERAAEEPDTTINPPPAEIIDIAQGLEQGDRDAKLHEQGRQELLAVERALSKMSTGHFGICEDCGEEIPARRLSVLPQARLCANCQAFEEKRNFRRMTAAR
ncbi:MAG: TraR/DksA family transcriptional regulator [Oligoflexia bacterium]|nr:TraR/DksA family transcriptional regulator [Oligoflexia bacterium]